MGYVIKINVSSYGYGLVFICSPRIYSRSDSKYNVPANTIWYINL